jgi:hypothetical protein
VVCGNTFTQHTRDVEVGMKCGVYVITDQFQVYSSVVANKTTIRGNVESTMIPKLARSCDYSHRVVTTVTFPI